MGKIDEIESAKAIPAGIIGKPDDIGELAKFLASDESRFIVDQTIILDGGQLLVMPLSGDFNEKRPDQFGRGYVQI